MAIDSEAIVLVDDDSDLCALVQRVSLDLGCIAMGAGSVAAGLLMCDVMLPELVIIDILADPSSGFALCRELRERGSARSILSILDVTPQGTPVAEALAAGADDCLTRPFGEDELRLRVKRLLEVPCGHGEAPRRHAGRIAVGDLLIDSLRLEVVAGGRRVGLTPKELEILAVLACHPGEVVPRDEIVRSVWGEGYSTATVNLALYVRHIRAKIEPNPKHPRYLQTVWRVGYRLNDERCCWGRSGVSPSTR